MITIKQLLRLRNLRDSVMTPDRFSRNGLAFDSMVPGPILDSILEILSDHELKHFGVSENAH